MKLPPAVAMQPPAPPQYRRTMPPAFAIRRLFRQTTVMALRSIVSHPVRTVFTMIGVAMATGILVVSLFTRDTMELLIDVTYFLADRQDATMTFGERRAGDVVLDVAHLPGVLSAEPAREVPVRIRYRSIERRIVLSGKPKDADLSRIIDVDLHPVTLPENGLAISAMLARVLGVEAGQEVEIDLLEGERRTVTLPVAATIEDYFGIRAMMDATALQRLLREAPSVNSVHVSVDAALLDAFYADIKAMPIISGLALQRISLENFREAVALLISTMATIYAGLAAIIAFGVVYNNARISLSESARDLASLRVLGFTRAEVLQILLLELALLTLLAQPLGWAVGYGLAWIMQTRLAGELMRVRLVVEPFTYALASITVIVAALFSALVVRGRVYGLDLVAVLKTRD
jgi:putative ABC transport system permease protein